MSRLKKIIAGLLISVIFYFLFRNIISYWGQVSDKLANINIYFILCAIGTYIIYCLILVQFWRFILGKLELYLGYMASLRIWISSMMIRYMPVGKGWSILGRVWLSKKEGLPKPQVLASIYLETVTAVIAGFLLAVIMGGFIGSDKLWFYKPGYILISVGLMLILLQPNILFKLMSRLLKLLKREPVDIKISSGDLWQITGFFLINWFLMGFIVYLIIRSLYPINIRLIPLVTGIYAMAWVLGFLVIIIPGGLGVREGVIAYLLSFYIPLPLASLAAVLSRLVFIISELILFLVVWGISPAKLKELIRRE